MSSYLSRLGSTNAGRFNASGRAVPDLSAAAANFPVYAAGFWFPNVTGTSASSPTMADVIALLNDRLISAGRPVMGFLNPWLYAGGYEAFTDVTTGNSSIVCDDGTNEQRGFNATEGWDPVSRRQDGVHCCMRVLIHSRAQITGFGTPSFDKLLKVLNL